MAFHGTDLYQIDGLLTDEERAARDSTQRWVDARFMPKVVQHWREGSFPMELAPEMGQLGLFGTHLTGYGCPGASAVVYGLCMEELERGDSGLRSFASVQGSLAMFPIWAYGSEAQKERYLPALAKGESIGCFALTEPDYGSDPGGMTTRARSDGDDFVLTGEKRWITNGSVADVAVVWAKVDSDDPKSVRGFLVDKGMPGFSSYDIEGKDSLRASITSGLRFEDLRLPKSAMLPGVQGLKGPLSCLNQARYGIAWGAVGSAIASFRAAVDYAKTRTQFDRPIASFQLVQAKLADMLTEIVKGQLLALQLGRLKDQGRASHVAVSLAKRNNVAMALDIARVARGILGANGVHDAYPVFRHMANLESVSTYEGTHDIHTLVLGRDITGLSAFA